MPLRLVLFDNMDVANRDNRMINRDPRDVSHIRLRISTGATWIGFRERQAGNKKGARTCGRLGDPIQAIRVLQPDSNWRLR